MAHTLTNYADDIINRLVHSGRYNNRSEVMRAGLRLLEEKEFALDLIRKIVIESKRESLFSRARKADSNFRKGKVRKGTVKDLFKDLEND